MNGLAFAVALVAALAFSAAATHGGVTAGAGQQTPAAQGMQGEPGLADMQGMMKMHEQMMAEMTAGDAKLDALVQAMNSATGAGG